MLLNALRYKALPVIKICPAADIHHFLRAAVR